MRGRGKTCHEEGCWSGRLQACCRRGRGEACIERAALLARHEKGCSSEGLQACYRKDKGKACFKGDVGVADLGML
jgi:hypothetical protein